MTNNSARSWFCVLNNPQNIFGDITPDEMVNKAIDMWTEDRPTRTCGINYEIGDSGTPHMHMVLEDSAKVRFTAIQKMFKGIHVEQTKGSKDQALDYIHKRGSFEEKNHTVVVPAVIRGEIKANKGKRRDLEIIQELIESGHTPNEVMDLNIQYRQYEKMIRQHFYRLRYKATPKHRDVVVFWHVGESGSGKSHTYIELCKQYGDEHVYLLNDYDNGGFDNYCGESVLFMDEFKGNIKFSTLLNLLDVYPIQVHCRYANAYALWTEVHITSVLYPEDAYKFMVADEMRSKDKISQLLRRINYVVVHKRVGTEYTSKFFTMDEYKVYRSVKDFECSCQEKDNPFI